MRMSRRRMRMATVRKPMITTTTELMQMKIVKIIRLSNGLQGTSSSKGEVMMTATVVAMMTDRKRWRGPHHPTTTGEVMNRRLKK